MKYYLNAYLSILKGNEGYEFGEINVREPQNRKTYQFEENQEAVFKKMMNQEGYEKEILEDTFGIKNVKYWIGQGVLIEALIDTKSIYSRSMSYYWHNKMGNVQGILASKSALILGCGGIGSHVAWNLTTLGVGKIILLDFDVVEESNLNRQILYDLKDIGKYKVVVLQEKLHNINPLIHIEALNQKISSEEELEQLIKDYPVDCVVKALDTPLHFSKWLDNVCQLNNTKYVAAIVMNSAQAIGPTFIPNKSAGFSELFEIDSSIDRISGISPSLSFIMYQMSGLVSEEVFKVLTNLGELKYTNKIVVNENITNKLITVESKRTPKIKQVKNYEWNSLVNLFVILLIFFIGLCIEPSLLITRIITIIYATLGPVIMYQTKKAALIYGFINVVSIMGFNMIILYARGGIALTQGFSSLLIILSALFIVMSIFTLIICVAQTLLFNVKNFILGRES